MKNPIAINLIKLIFFKGLAILYFFIIFIFMKEDLITYLWQNQLFSSPLVTDEGEPVSIQTPGKLNRDSGPDFSGSRIKIGQTTWAGNTELHIKASDWYQHNHHKDPAYDNIILHVVMENDAEIKRSNGEKIPVVSIKGKYDKSIEERYRQFLKSRSWIACEGQTEQVPEIVKNNWLERMAVERLEERSARIYKYLRETNYDWEQAFFQLLCRSFGFKVNAEPFELLGKHIPLRLLKRNRYSLRQVEAFVFGQAGFLEKAYQKPYAETLSREYQALKNKYELHPLQAHIWKFMRLRPSNFPTIRIAQLSALLYKSEHLLRPVLEASSPEEIKKIYNVKASGFWDNHYHFEKSQTRSIASKKLGNSAINLILINAIIPFLFIYGKYHNQPKYQEKALDWLMQLPPEKNHITKKYIFRGFPCNHALQSQALIQLRENYCKKKKCLECHIGHALLSGNHKT